MKVFKKDLPFKKGEYIVSMIKHTADYYIIATNYRLYKYYPDSNTFKAIKVVRLPDES